MQIVLCTRCKSLFLQVLGSMDYLLLQYYIYQGDMVSGVEDLRTPLSTILELERHVRGSIAGFVTPNFVVDLPGGGGKRLASSFDSYDPQSGLSKFVLPGKDGGKERVYEYWDPVSPTTTPSLSGSAFSA